MGPLLRALWNDAAFARTALLSAIAFLVAFYTIDPTLTTGARIAIALGQTFLVGGSSALPTRASNVAKTGSVLFFALALGLGCASRLPEIQTPGERYYAAVSDYLVAEEQAVRFCESPVATVAQCEAIEKAIVAAKLARGSVSNAMRAAGAVPDERFVKAAAVLTSLLLDLEQILAGWKETP